MTWSNAFSTSWHVFCREREVQEILLHSFYTASLYYSRDRRENTRPCANCLKTFQPCRASSLFAVDCFSFLSRPRVFFPANGMRGRMRFLLLLRRRLGPREGKNGKSDHANSWSELSCLVGRDILCACVFVVVEKASCRIFSLFVEFLWPLAESYTHLTLPTICSV